MSSAEVAAGAAGQGVFPKNAGDSSKPPAESRPSTVREKIIDALQTATRIDFNNQPLADCVDYLQDFHHIPIRFDSKAIRAAKIPPFASVSVCLAGITLHNVLRQMLREFDLTHVVTNDTLVITTPEGARRLVAEGALDPATYRSPRAIETAKVVAARLRTSSP